MVRSARLCFALRLATDPPDVVLAVADELKATFPDLTLA